MFISYNTEYLQEICNSAPAAIKLLGEEGAVFLHARIADIKASDTVFDLPTGEASIDGNVCTLKYKKPFSIKAEPGYGSNNIDKTYDWATVRRLKILRINDAA